MQHNNLQDGLNQALRDEVGRVETTVCLSHRLLIISEDKLELALRSGIEKVESRTAWAVPAGLLLSCVIALATSTFHNLFGIPAPVWQALFIISGLGSAVWLVMTLVKFRRFSSGDFLNDIRSLASHFNGPDVTQTESPQPLDSITRRLSNDVRAAPQSIHKIIQPPSADLMRVGPVKAPTVVKPAVPFGGAMPLSQLLQCKNCGFPVKARAGTLNRCAKCGLFN